MDFEPNCLLTSYEVKKVDTCQVHISCLQGVRNVDYLLMAKLVALSTLENPPRFSEQKIMTFFVLLVAGSSLRRS